MQSCTSSEDLVAFSVRLLVFSLFLWLIDRPDSSDSSTSDSCAKGGKFEPHCQQVDSDFHPSVGQ